jgi:hypothetical protein
MWPYQNPQNLDINCKSIINTSMLCVIEGGGVENNEKFIIDLNIFEEG